MWRWSTSRWRLSQREECRQVQRSPKVPWTISSRGSVAGRHSLGRGSRGSLRWEKVENPLLPVLSFTCKVSAKDTADQGEGEDDKQTNARHGHHCTKGDRPDKKLHDKKGLQHFMPQYQHQELFNVFTQPNSVTRIPLNHNNLTNATQINSRKSYN